MRALDFRPYFSLFLLMLGSFATMPAHASFGDCNSTAYLGLFDERLARDSGFLCVESGRTPIRSDAGTSHVRIVQHLNSDWATRPGAMRAFKQGVDASATAMASLGGFRISDVTILLVDGFAPGSDKEVFGEIAAWTNFAPGDECRITVWLLGSGATASYGASVIAHELFHCVQRSSLSSGQLFSSAPLGTSGGGTWWQEGSADWFSTVATVPPRYMSDRVRAFDNKSLRTPLNKMTYDAYVFFAWLGGARGRESVMPFLRSMASGSAESAQRSAMISALPADQWLRFAQDYMDKRIRDGRGGSIGSTPRTVDTYDWEATRTQRINLAPFTLNRANINFRCGRWRVEARPQKFHAVKPDRGDSWGNFPAGIDAMDGTPRLYSFVGMAASSAEVALQVVGTLESSCQECAATREIDRCLIGTWQMTVDGMQQWMREHIRQVHVTSGSLANNTMTLNEDRSFITGASQVSAHLETVMSDPHATASGTLTGQISGRWSAAGGQFNLCPDAGDLAGTIKVKIHGQTLTRPMPATRMQPSTRHYSCAANSLTITTSMGGAGNATWVYTRVSGPR